MVEMVDQDYTYFLSECGELEEYLKYDRTMLLTVFLTTMMARFRPIKLTENYIDDIF